MAEGLRLETIAQEANEKFGDGTVITGSALVRDPPRLPFGVFAVDFATGGGCPIWGTTCLWGPEAGGKTSLAINAVSMVGRLCWGCFRLKDVCTCSGAPRPMKAVWLDVEGTFDREWANHIGAGPDDYFYALADYGEMYVNFAEKFLCSDECGLVVLDSLAALVPIREFEAGSEDQFIGNQAKMVTNCVRKIKQRLIRERKREHPCTVIFINQMRKKIGEMFGNPETMPGGHGMLHEFSLLLRIVQKALTEQDKKKFVDSKRKKDAATRHSFTIRKEKVLTLARTGEFIRLTDWIPELSLGRGVVDDHRTTLDCAKQYNILEKKGDNWRILGKKAKRQSDFLKLWRKDPGEYHRVQTEVLLTAKEELERGAGA
jgi:RecA/RadA recombinase